MPNPNRNCERARVWSSLRADGELSELEGALLDAHLSRCAGCRSFAAGLDGVEALLRAEPLEQPERRVEVRRRSAGRSLRVLQAGAAVAVVATGGLGALVVGVFHAASESSASPVIQRVSAVNDESPRTMRELRRVALVAAAQPRVARHLLQP